MDVDNPVINATGETAQPSDQTPVPPLMFNFPEEQARGFTAADIIAILKVYGAGPPPWKRGPKKPEYRHNTAELAALQDAAIDAVLGKDQEKRRVIFRHWPRDPKGKYITPENSLPGKTTPNGLQLWGATIFDFYRVRRIPDLPNLSTITTGSKLLKWMKANEELEYAKDEIEWAEMEDEPSVIEPWSPGEAVLLVEENIRRRKAGKSFPEISQVDGKKTSTGSIFERSNYPSPWPLVPFSYETECLTHLIPLERLPKKIVVHDPWNLLAVSTRNRYGRAEAKSTDHDWTSRPDRTHIYNIKLSEVAQARLDREQALRGVTKSTNSDEVDDGSLEGYLIRPPTTPGPIVPPIFVVHDRSPEPVARPDDPIQEAHVYLSPAHPIGTGNHSVVYQAEWELPRTVMFPPPSDPVLCRECVDVDIARILKETDGEHGERRDPKWDEKSASMKIVRDGRPGVTFYAVDEHALANGNAAGNGREFDSPDTSEFRVEFEGPVRPIHTTVGWQDPMHPTCAHIKVPPPTPPTVKVRVVAKLSNMGDQHLKAEAKNYQKFERHMFENWSGLNVLPPMHDPVPVGALVPQFYGYYEPAPEVEEEDDDAMVEDGAEKTAVQPRGYLSPILLLEDCGRDVDAGTLTIDQRNEATSLLYRFHVAGWVHGSVYARNFLVQRGPLDVPPAERSNRHMSFRLIDFGRSYCDDDTEQKGDWRSERMYEERKIETLFDTRMF